MAPLGGDGETWKPEPTLDMTLEIFCTGFIVDGVQRRLNLNKILPTAQKLREEMIGFTKLLKKQVLKSLDKKIDELFQEGVRDYAAEQPILARHAVTEFERVTRELLAEPAITSGMRSRALAAGVQFSDLKNELENITSSERLMEPVSTILFMPPKERE